MTKLKRVVSNCGNSLKTRPQRRNWTELFWHCLVFDKLTSGQAVMHYSRHRLTTSVAHVTTPTYALSNDQRVRFACPLVSSPQTNRVISVQVSYVAVYMPLQSRTDSFPAPCFTLARCQWPDYR